MCPDVNEEVKMMKPLKNSTCFKRELRVCLDAIVWKLTLKNCKLIFSAPVLSCWMTKNRNEELINMSYLAIQQTRHLTNVWIDFWSIKQNA